jgi:hypothetical protein
MTLDNWAASNPEFLDALTLAKEHEQAYWEDLGHKHMTTTGFAQNCWGRNMAARFPKDWRESKQVDHGVTNELAALLGAIDGNGASLL